MKLCLTHRSSRRLDEARCRRGEYPEGGIFKDKAWKAKGRYRPDLPAGPPACWAASLSLQRSSPEGEEEHLYNQAKVMEKAIADDPDTLAILKAHYLRWVVFTITGESYLMYQGIFDTDFDQYCEDASILFGKTGVQAIFESSPEGWPGGLRDQSLRL